MQRRRVEDEGSRPVNSFYGERLRTVPHEQGPANYVPAAAVRRRVQALSGFTGRKARVGGLLSAQVKAPGSTRKLLCILAGWRDAEVCGIPGVTVKCVDIRRNTHGEGSRLGVS